MWFGSKLFPLEFYYRQGKFIELQIINATITSAETIDENE